MGKKKAELRTTESNSNVNENKEKNLPLGICKQGNQKKR